MQRTRSLTRLHSGHCALYVSIICSPPHPFRLDGKSHSSGSRFPISRDFRSFPACARFVVSLDWDQGKQPAAPGLSAAKSGRSGWFPKHRGGPVRDWAHDVLLVLPNCRGRAIKCNPLVELAELDAKSTGVRAAHVPGSQCTPLAILPQYECVHVIPRALMFARAGQNPFRASRLRSSFTPSCKQTRRRGCAIRDSRFDLEISTKGHRARSAQSALSMQLKRMKGVWPCLSAR